MTKRRSIQSKTRKGRAKHAPYTKYNKTPYIYSADYREWRSKIMRKAARVSS